MPEQTNSLLLLFVKLVSEVSKEIFGFHTTVTLNEGQGHSNSYQNEQFHGLYYYTNFERNQSLDV